MFELKSLISYFLKHAHKNLNRTELMKYIYLFEYYYYQMYQRQFTNLTFERYKFGPNESAIVDMTFELQQEGLIAIETYENIYKGTSYSHKALFDTCQYQLTNESEEVGSFVVDLLWNKSYKGVLDVAYATPPMQEIIAVETRENVLQYGRVIDMSKSKKIFKSSRQARMEAKKRLEQEPQSKGTDEEYYSEFLNQYKRFEDTRRRANSVQ